MRKIKDKNLFTDIYELREELSGINANDSMNELLSEVQKDIQNEKIPSKIRYLLLKTTNLCNSNCVYCSHAQNRVPREEKFSLPNEIIMKTIEEAADMGVDAISISGGEPLLRKDIFDIISKTVECGIMPVLLTNGLLLEKMWNKLGEAGLRYIIISVDSIDKEIYEKQRGASLKSVLNGIEAAIKLREKYKTVEIHVSAVLTRDNQDDFLKLLDYMNDRKIKVQISPYHKREHDAEDFSISEYNKISELANKLVKMKKQGYQIANSEKFIRHLPDFFCSDKVVPDDFKCMVGYTSLAIDTYMNVKPCWSFVYEPIGNLQDVGLKEIWHSKKMQEYRKKMLQCECEGCWYLCTSEVCMMLDNLFN